LTKQFKYGRSDLGRRNEIDLEDHLFGIFSEVGMPSNLLSFFVDVLAVVYTVDIESLFLKSEGPLCV
jgi:hypothetical protein